MNLVDAIAANSTGARQRIQDLSTQLQGQAAPERWQAAGGDQVEGSWLGYLTGR